MSAEVEQERSELREVTASFLAREQDLASVRHALERGYDHEVWRRLCGELGLGAVGMPEASGGTGESLSDLVVVTEELGRHLDPGPFVPSIVLGARVLAAAGWDASRVEQVVSGRTTVSVVLPDHAPTIEARRANGTVLLTGHARNVLHGGSVDDLVLVAQLPEGPTLARVATGETGVDVQVLPAVDGTRPLADVALNDAPAEILGAPGAAAVIGEPVLVLARIATAAELVGVAQGALDLTVSYAKERHQFGRPIGSFQAIKHRLVDVMMHVEASRTAVRHAASAFDAGDPEGEQLSHLCQAVASDAAMAAGKAAVQVHGAIGFTWEHDAHLFLKRAMSGARFLGSARENRASLAALLLDQQTTTRSDVAAATPEGK